MYCIWLQLFEHEVALVSATLHRRTSYSGSRPTSLPSHPLVSPWEHNFEPGLARLRDSPLRRFCELVLDTNKNPQVPRSFSHLWFRGHSEQTIRFLLLVSFGDLSRSQCPLKGGHSLHSATFTLPWSWTHLSQDKILSCAPPPAAPISNSMATASQKMSLLSLPGLPLLRWHAS